jgi:hypothetical protein
MATVKKMAKGGNLGMKSVKAGFDKNPGVTRADIIVAAKKQAKYGSKMKKAQSGKDVPKGYVKGEMTGKLYKKSDMDKQTKGFATELQKVKAAPVKKDTTKVKKTMKKGGSVMGKCKYGC